MNRCIKSGLLFIPVFLLTTTTELHAGFLDIRVIQSSDDAEESVSTGNVSLTSTDLELVFDGVTEQIVGVRFQDVTLPQGATILSAVLEFETDETDTGSTSITIRGEDTDNAATFTTTNSDLSSRTTTTASVDWTSIPSWSTVSEKHQSPDITSIVQEIVDRPGWTSDNAMVFLLEAASSGCSSSACQRTAESFNGEAAAATALRIEFDGVLAAPSSSICYSVADSNDELKEITTTGVSAGSLSTLGDTDVSSIEALAYQVKHGVLYGADSDQLGRINRNTGQFFALESTFGTGSATIGGSATSVTMSDADGLSFDPTTAVLYGSNASAGADELFVILFRTGELLEDAFGTGEDFVEITGTGADDIGTQVDDIAFDPDDNGQLYASNGDELYQVDKATGTTTLIGDFRVGSTTGTDITDMEGLSFDDTGQLYGTTGTSGPGSTRNRLWTIDKTDGVATQVGTGTLGSGTDYESVECVFTSDLTYASVASFAAFHVAGKTVVEWTSAGEAGTLGFRLLRSSDRKERYQERSERLLPGLLTSPQGGVYRFVDPDAEVGETYSYQLLEVEASGRERIHGPFEVTVEASSRQDLLKAVEASSAFSRSPHPLAPASRASSASRTIPGKARSEGRLRGRIVTAAPGLYFLPAENIAAAFDLSISEARQHIAQNALHLSHRGEAVRLLSEEGVHGVYFFAEKIESIYTDENVYWLDLDNGTTPEGDRDIFADDFESGDAAAWSSCTPACPGAPRDPSLTAGAEGTSFRDTIRFEEDRWPVTSILGDPEDGFWLWEFILAGDPSSGTAELAFRVENPAPADTAHLSLELLGASTSDAPGDHHAVVHLNGARIGEDTWEGRRRHTLRMEIDADLLLDGENHLTVTGLLNEGVAWSVFYIDAFSLSYERRYIAVDGALLFSGDGNEVVTVGGFSSPQLALFDLRRPAAPRRITRFHVADTAGNYQIRFAPRDRAAPYLAVDLAGVDALPVTPFLAEDLERKSADYLVVAPPELQEGARRLARYRRDRGLPAEVVTLDQIYARFHHGLPHPLAVREFLRHAHARWARPPRYVVLLGDGDFDYKDVLGLGENLVPPFLIGTPSGLMSSDVAIADFLAGDGVPDVALGRLPARYPAELDAMIDKIIAYEDSSAGSWRRHHLLVADNPDSAGDFSSKSDRIAELLPSTATYEQIHLGELTSASARHLLLTRLEEGAAMINFVGHGGLDRFADEGILVRGDVETLANGDRLPIIAAMTCLAGRFDLPGFASLGEALVRAENRGAIAFWGPGLLSNDADAATLDQAFYRAIQTPGISTLGDAIVEAQRALVETSSANRAMPFLYTLLGDPALELP